MFTTTRSPARPSDPLTSFTDTLGALEKTYALVKPHVDPKTGIIPWVKRLPTPYAGHAFHIFLAKHPVIGRVDSLQALLANIRASSSAIGYTPRHARLLAICEALERWSCVSQDDEYAELHTYNEIRDRAIGPAILHGFSVRQYADRETNNQLYPDGGRFIPEPLDPDKKVRWCPIYDLANASWKYVLKSSCYYGYHDEGHVFSVADSRGVAAGPSREFCLWQGLLELIETDAVAIWNANRLRRPGVDVASFENAALMRLCQVHEALGRDLWVLDVSMDIEGIRVFAAISRDRAGGGAIKGFGTHPIAGKALEKALLECCQMLPNVIPLQDESGEPLLPPRGNTATDEAPAHFFPDASSPRGIDHYRHMPRTTCIGALIDTLASKGITPLVLDATRPELGIVVLRVYAAGMRSWFPREGPGRLYEVPVNLGFRDAPLAAHEHYPIPVES